MTNTGPFSWNGLSKMQFFTDIWYPFCRRLLRPADVTFLKNSCCTQKFPISAFQNHLQTKSNLHIFIPSEPIHKVHFKMRHPVVTFEWCLGDFEWLGDFSLRTFCQYLDCVLFFFPSIRNCRIFCQNEPRSILY